MVITHNYVDKKKLGQIDYNDQEYVKKTERIYEKFY